MGRACATNGSDENGTHQFENRGVDGRINKNIGKVYSLVYT
jgi:hypothetical protein